MSTWDGLRLTLVVPPVVPYAAIAEAVEAEAEADARMDPYPWFLLLVKVFDVPLKSLVLWAERA